MSGSELWQGSAQTMGLKEGQEGDPSMAGLSQTTVVLPRVVMPAAGQHQCSGGWRVGLSCSRALVPDESHKTLVMLPRRESFAFSSLQDGQASIS